MLYPVTERHDPHAGHRTFELRCGALDQVRDARHRDRDVVTQHRDLPRHRLGRVLAQRPQGLALRLARRDHAVLDERATDGFFQHLLQLRAEPLGKRPGDLGEHIPRRRPDQRGAGPGQVAQHQLDATAGE